MTPDAYQRALSTCQRFSREQEAALHQRMQQGDTEARALLIRSLLPWVVALAAKFHRRNGYPLDDCIQAGNVGLIRAVDRFDPTKGRLVTYSTARIRQAMMFARDEDTTIRVPACVRYPVKKHIGFTMEQRDRWMSLRIRPAQINETLMAPDDEPEAPRSDELRGLHERIAQLPAAWQEIIHARLSGASVTEIAEARGITKQRVQQIHAKAVERLRGMYGQDLDQTNTAD